MKTKILVKLLTLALILLLLPLSGCVKSGDEGEASDLENEPESPKSAFTSGIAPVEKISIEMKKTGIPPEIRVFAKGNLSDGCTRIDRENITVERENFKIKINIPTLRPAEAFCPQVLVPFEEQIPLDLEGFEIGNYTVKVNDIKTGFKLTPYDLQAPGEAYAPGKAAVNKVMVIMSKSIPPQVVAVVSGTLSGNCERLDSKNIKVERQKEGLILVDLPTLTRENAPCTLNLVFFTEHIPIDIEGLEAGEYTVRVNGVESSFVLGNYDKSQSLETGEKQPAAEDETKTEDADSGEAEAEGAQGKTSENYGLLKGNLFFEENPSGFKNASLSVRLEDVSLMDAPSTLISETLLQNVAVDSKENKIPFTLEFPELEEKRTYSLSAHIDVDGDGKISSGDYLTTTHHEVPPGENKINMALTVELV